MYRILYVDDEPSLLEITKLFLEDINDFSVDVDTAAQHALNAIGTQSYDAIISDYQMPEMDGIAFLKAVRSRYGDIPFILFTGRGREEVVIEAINNGADFYLQKGGDPTAQFAELAHKVRQAIARRQAEFSLIESEKRLADIINFLPDATLAIDSTGKVIAWNRAIEEMTGFAAADMLGKGEYEYAIPFYGSRRPILIDLISEPEEKIAKYYSNIILEGTMLTAESDLPHPKGNRIHVMAKASPLYNRQGEIVGAIESIRNITGLKNAEEGLLRAHKDWETIFRAIGHPTIVLDANNHIIDANDAALTATGKSPEDLKGKRCFEIFHGPDAVRPPDGCPFEQFKRTGIIETADMEMEALNGYYHVSCTPVFDTSGNLEKVIHIAMDVTDRRRTQDELRAAYEQLTASQEELKGQFNELALNASRIRESESRLTFMLGLYEKAQQPEHTLLFYAVEGACSVTGSPLTYLAFLNDDESELAMYAWSQTAMRECSMLKKPVIYPVERTGLWGEAIRQRRPVITNDYLSFNPKKKGYPEGHPQIIRHMNIPVMEGNHIVIVAGVANKSSDYTDNDVRDLTLLMQSLWQVLKRRRAEEALQQANLVVENSPVVVFRWKVTEGRPVVFVSQNVTRFGYTREELLSGAISYSSMVHPDDLERIAREEQKYSDGGIDRFHLEYRILTRDGGIRWIDDHTVIERGKDGQVTYYQGILIDITDRKLTEDELGRSCAILKSVVESPKEVVIFALDRQYRYIAFNENHSHTMKQIWGVDIALGISMSEYIRSPDDRKKAIVNFDRALSGETFTLVERYGDTELKRRWYEDTYNPITDENDNVIGLTVFLTDITERKVAEQALRESEERYRNQFENNNVVMLLVDPDTGAITDANPAACGFYGWSRDDLTKKKIYEINTLSIGEIQAELQSASTQKRNQFTFKHRRSDGTIREVEVYSTPVLIGGRLLLYSIIFDITERKRAQEALMESREQYKQIFESFVDLYIQTDKNGIITVLSPSTYSVTGWNPEELIGRHVSVLYASQTDRQAFLERLNREHLVHGFEIMLKKRDGTSIPVSINTRMRFNESGEPDGIVGSIRDITDSVRARKALEESEKKYRHILENMQDAYFRADKNGYLTMVSPSAARIYGYGSPDEMTGIPAVSLYKRPDQRQEVLQKLQESGKITDFTGEALRKDGTTFWVSLNIQFIIDNDGCIDGTEGIIRDITERKNMEQAIHEINRKLALLTSITRHDVSNQVSALRGFTKIAMMKKPDPVVADLLEKIDATGSVIARQIAFTKVYQELGMHAPGWHRISEIVAHQKTEGVSVSCTCDAEVFSDPMLEKVFFNLIDNAIRHGERVTTIACSCKPGPEGLVITVEDNGAGVPMNLKEKIFEKGFGKQTGFGLFLAREILAITGIYMHETGVHGKGARFEITVPEGNYRFAKT